MITLRYTLTPLSSLSRLLITEPTDTLPDTNFIKNNAIRSMTINISTALRRWLLEKGLEGYIKVTEAPPHPDAFNIAQKLNVDTVTNAMVR